MPPCDESGQDTAPPLNALRDTLPARLLRRLGWTCAAGFP